MNKKDRIFFETRLQEERARLVKELKHLDDTILNKSLKDSTGDLSSYSFHMADQGTDSIEREKAFLAASAEGRQLIEVYAALKRLFDGEYGKCSACDQDIARKRLEAVPYATLCLICKQKEEKKAGRR